MKTEKPVKTILNTNTILSHIHTWLWQTTHNITTNCIHIY